VRIVKAAQLAQVGYVPFVLVDGPTTLIGHESDMTMRYAQLRGYPPSLFRAVPLPADVTSTRAEAQYVGKCLKSEHIHKILLVTSHYHTRRAAYWFRRENPGLQVVAISAVDPLLLPNSWWRYREGEKTFVLEWSKTITECWLGIGN
jgi:uncharacterized SAM-binding protein YcdF (DUF218 family)